MQAAGLTGANLEGKEQRFGDAGTALYATVTTSGASGAVNGAMESLSGTGALAPLSLMMTGELAFGGIGSGLSSMLLVVLLTVFLAGLLVGRTPEYVGRKLDVRTVKLVVIGTLAAPMLALGAAGLATATDFGRVSIFDSGPQGFSRDPLRVRLADDEQRLGVRGLHRLRPAAPTPSSSASRSRT